MRDEAPPPGLDELAADYEIVGELARGGGTHSRVYLGKRRRDDLPVLVTVARTPDGDEGNALSLFAADANLLATLSHRNLLPILEGRWVGTDSFAVVNERPSARSLGELLDREQLSYPRAAALLQDVGALLEWARREKLAHRSVNADSLHLEPSSDRVLASFAISPIPFGRVSPIGTDARTIAELAEQMVGGREDLAQRVRDELTTLKNVSPTGESEPDISSFVSLIAMNEALRMGDVEYERARHAIESTREEARLKLESEQRDHERALEEQRRELDRERQECEREVERERAALAKERAALEREIASLQRDRAEHERDRAEHERDRAEHERDRVAVTTAGTAAREAPARARPTTPTVVRLKSVRRRLRLPRAWLPWNRQRSVRSVSVALVVLIALAAVVSEGHYRTARVSTARPSPVRVTESAAGETVRWAVPLPRHVPESAFVAAAMADTARMRRLARARSARRMSERDSYQPVERDLTTAPAERRIGDTIVPTDTVARPRPPLPVPFGAFGFPMAPPSRSVPPSTDSARRIDTIPRPAPDTMPSASIPGASSRQ